MFGEDRVLYWTPFTSDRWGNALSGYWQARALARLAGFGFDAYVGFEGASWLAWLPKKLPPAACADPPAFAAACGGCAAEAWEHPHRCGGPWPGIRDVITDDTRRALEAWAAAEGRRLPEYGPGDVVIQARCAKDTLLGHPEYGPVAFSFYTDHIDRASARRIQIVSDPRPHLPACRLLQEARAAHLRASFPDARVEAAGGQSWEDFARLVRAPVVFRDSQSSFGLWAGVANTGKVYSVPLLKSFTANHTPDLGPGWHWVDAPVLYPSVAQELGLTLDDPGAIVKWLQAH